MARKDKIARAITNAITQHDSKRRSMFVKLVQAILAFFALFNVKLYQHARELFASLRESFNIDTDSYSSSFGPSEDGKPTLQTKGTMGYSGSTFFTTSDEKYLIKSVPRHFEHSFFRDDLLQPYTEHMKQNLHSLLIRITDFLAVDSTYRFSPAIFFGTTPSHHIVMENLLVGKDEGEAVGKDSFSNRDPEEDEPWKWQTWDLKPTTYFFPERDIAQGKLTSEATKSRLADEFHDKLILKQEDAEQFMTQLRKDTELLSHSNTVDYSLFLVRIPIPPKESDNPFSDAASEEQDSTTNGRTLPKTVPTPREPPFTPPSPPSWRTGIASADGKYVYRAAILDFFWAKHKLHAKMMTFLINVWNKIDISGDKGPMSITTTSSEYRERFLKMCEGYIEVRDSVTQDNEL